MRPKNLFSFMLNFLAPYKLYAFGFVVCAMISGLYGVVNSNLTKIIIDSLSATTISQESLIASIFWPALFFVINFEIHNLTWRGMAIINYKIQPVIKNNIISYTYGYVLKHSHRFFQDSLAGKVANSITNLADAIERSLHEIAQHIIRGIVLLIGALISMYFVNPLFFYGLLVWTIIFGIISYFVSKNIAYLAETYAESETLVSGQLVDGISNSQNIRIFARNDYESSYILKALKLMKDRFKRKELFLIKFHLLQGFSQTLVLGFMMYTLIYLRAANLVTTGDFALILGLTVEVGFTLWWVTEQIDHLNGAIGKANQSLKALFVENEIQDMPNSTLLIVKNGEIVFEKVRFQYKGVAPLFQNKSIKIESASKVGLVGYSGSGKSTFVNLILRLFDVSNGRILIDNQDISMVTQDSLRSAIAMIPQDPSLFHRSLIENIRYGKITASDEEVIEAAKQAHAHEFILELPEGYQSLVGERGIKLSGGQRQRVAIARAILKNAPILILDEATSQLDSITEGYIQESLEELMQGKTTIIIAHRLSTLLHMDRILVFDYGNIVEDGSHQTLVSKKGLYKSLWDAQVGGFLPHKKSVRAL